MTYLDETTANQLGSTKELRQAKELTEQGQDAQQVYEQTGWYQNENEMFETWVPDNEFSLDHDKISYDPTPVSEVAEHPVVFDVLPGLGDTSVQNAAPGSAEERALDYHGALGYYNPDEDKIVLRDGAGAQDQKEIIAHELLGHGVQDQLNYPEEGRGTNPEEAGGMYEYRNQTGEAAAFDIMENLDEGVDPDFTPDLVDRAAREDEGGTPDREYEGIGGAS